MSRRRTAPEPDFYVPADSPTYGVVEAWAGQLHQVECNGMRRDCGRWAEHRATAEQLLGVPMRTHEWPIRFTEADGEPEVVCGVCDSRIGTGRLFTPDELAELVRAHQPSCPALTNPPRYAESVRPRSSHVRS